MCPLLVFYFIILSHLMIMKEFNLINCLNRHDILHY